MRLPKPHPAALLALPIVDLEDVPELDLEPDPEQRVPDARGHRFLVSRVPALWDDPAGDSGSTTAGKLSAVFMTLTAVSIIGTAVAVLLAR